MANERYVYKPVSPECERFLPGFCLGQTLCYWPTGHCPAPAAALPGPLPDAGAWKKNKHTHTFKTTINTKKMFMSRWGTSQ